MNDVAPYQTVQTDTTAGLLQIRDAARARAESLLGSDLPEDVDLVTSFSSPGGTDAFLPELNESLFKPGGALETVDPDAVRFEAEPAAAAETAAVNTVRNLTDKIEADDEALAAIAETGGDVSADRFFKTNAPGNREAEFSISVYETGAREDRIGSALFEDREDVGELLRAIDDVPEGFRLSRLETGSDDIEAAFEEADERRETREAARDAAEAAGVDLDEFDVGATAEGEVILQDEDTGRTRRIDADAGSGLGDAIDAETFGGEFVADTADPAAGATSAGGLGARAVAAIVLLLGAIAAAVGWSG